VTFVLGPGARASVGPIVLVGLLGCGDTTEGASVEDGVAPQDAGWLTEPELVLRVGEGADDPALFHEVVAVLEVRDGLLVLENGPPSIRRLDASGRVVAQIGREGDGPGEFRRLSSASRFSRDSVFVFDGRTRRVTIYGPDLALARTFSLQGDPAPTLSRAEPGAGGIVAFGGTVIIPGGPVGFRRPEGSLLLFGPEGSFMRQLAAVPGRETYTSETGGFVLRLLGRESVWAGGADGLYLGTGESAMIEFIDGSGSRRDWAPVPAPPPDLGDAEKLELLDALTRSAPNEWGSATRIRATAEIAPLADRLPSLRKILVAEGGSVLAAAYPDPRSESREWWVFSEDGSHVGTLSLPVRFRMTDVRDGIAAGLGVDSLGVEHVELWRVKSGR